MSKKSESAEGAARKPPCESPSRYFCAVAQCDYSEQMDVIRWLLQDDSYTCIYIMHDADTYTDADITEKGENGVITRKNGDGTMSEFRAGDKKPAHIHIIVETKTKMRSNTLTTRFCSQLRFFACQKEYGDKYEAARYLTHESFRARSKHKYERSKVKYSEGGSHDSAITLYAELMQTEDGALLDDLREFIAIKEQAGDTVQAVRATIATGNARAVKRIMSHAYFYDKML